MRYKLTIAYRGTHYHGWQFQTASRTWKGAAPLPERGLPTIQENVSRALSHVVRHPVTVSGSSRTDAGVHAKGQIAHFDTDQTQIPPDGLRDAANHQLPDDILIRSIESVPDAFDATTWTTSKRYQYFIWNSLDRPVFLTDLAWHRWQELNIREMEKCAAMLVGEHDFASFARPGHKRENTVRTITSCDISYRSPRMIIGIEGNGFLWNMVRIMVGTLVEVGLGRYGTGSIKRMLETKTRKEGGSTAPPQGLYLQWIKTRNEPQMNTDEHRYKNC
jgi:tRNA pseudouridine38-40 synthase